MNILTLTQAGKLPQFNKEASHLNIEVLGVNEARWPGFDEHSFPSKQVFLYSNLKGIYAPKLHGVILLVSDVEVDPRAPGEEQHFLN